MIADTFAHLKTSAYRVFHLKFKNKEIAYFWTDFYEDVFLCGSEIKKKSIEKLPCLEELSLTLKTFGPSIRKLSILIQSKKTIDNLPEKCCENLIELNVVLLREEDFKLTRPFPRLRKFKIITNKFMKNNNSPLPVFKLSVNLNRYFPQLRCLEIESQTCGFEFDDSFITHIPNLVKFSFHSVYIDRKFCNNIAKFTNLNNQITNLSLNPNNYPWLAPSIKWHTFNLRKFSLWKMKMGMPSGSDVVGLKLAFSDFEIFRYESDFDFLLSTSSSDIAESYVTREISD